VPRKGVRPTAAMNHTSQAPASREGVQRPLMLEWLCGRLAGCGVKPWGAAPLNLSDAANSTNPKG